MTDWGKGIPEFKESDLVTEEELLLYAMQVVEDVELKKNGYEIVAAKTELDKAPNFVAKKDGRLYFIVVKGDIAPYVPDMTIQEKMNLLEHAKAFNAECYFAPVSFGADDEERFRKGLLLRGDALYSRYKGLEKI